MNSLSFEIGFSYRSSSRWGESGRFANSCLTSLRKTRAKGFWRIL